MIIDFPASKGLAFLLSRVLLSKSFGLFNALEILLITALKHLICQGRNLKPPKSTDRQVQVKI
jgi:hypothetical protein